MFPICFGHPVIQIQMNWFPRLKMLILIQNKCGFLQFKIHSSTVLFLFRVEEGGFEDIFGQGCNC